MRIFIVVLAVFLVGGCSAKKDFKNMTFSGTLEMTEHVLGAKVAVLIMGSVRNCQAIRRRRAPERQRFHHRICAGGGL